MVILRGAAPPRSPQPPILVPGPMTIHQTAFI